MENFGDFLRKKCMDFAVDIVNLYKYLCVAKVFISLKECSETDFWLELLFRTNYLTQQEYDGINYKCKEITKILTSIAKNSRQ